MRCLAILLLAAATTAASEDFGSIERIFNQARKQASTPGARAVVLPAIEKMVACKDVRAVRGLATFLVETFARETEALELLRTTQRGGAKANTAIDEIGKELHHLQLKRRAGDVSVGPRIQELLDKRRREQEAFEHAKRETARFGRLVGFLRELRSILADGAAEVLRKANADSLERGFRFLRASFDPTEHAQGLFLVRILRECGRAGAEAHLLDLLAQPKVGRPVRVTALQAVAAFRSRRGCETLLRLARQEKALRPHVLHALSLAAHKKLGSLKAASAWVAELQ